MAEAEKEALLDGAQYSPLFQLKKKVLIMSLVLRYFFCGLEYAIILPTALLYMRSLSGGHEFMGLVIGLYPLAAIFTLPLFGYMYDRTKKIRELLIVLNCFQVIGNFVYAIPVSKWLPLLGRFIGGLGDGFIALTVGEVTYLYNESDRIGIFSLMELGRVLGLIIGPTVNFVIEDWEVEFQHWSLDNKNLPGFIMGCCWILMQVITIFCVHNLTLEKLETDGLDDSPYLKRARADSDRSNGGQGEIKKEGSAYLDSDEDSLFGSSYGLDSRNEKSEEIGLSAPEAPKIEKSDKIGSLDPDDSKNEKSEKIGLLDPNDIFPIPEREKEPLTLREKVRKYCDESREKISDAISDLYFNSSIASILYIEFLVIFLVDLVLWFSQTTFEVLCPYVTEFEYKWSPGATGAIYMGGGAVIIIVFIGLFFFRRYCNRKDVYLLVASLVFTQISLALLIYESVPKNLSVRVACFILICVLVFMSIPVNLVCSKTLLTRLVRPAFQGTVQGVASAVSRLAMIAGPLLSGFIFTHRQIYGSIMSVFTFITIVCLILCMKMIRRREEEVREKTAYR